jgi:hypothetical protein
VPAPSWDPSILAYVGLPGQEFLPQFFGLLAWAAAAFLAILQWPIIALWRRFSKRKEVKDEPKSEPARTEIQESPGEGSEVKR